MGHDGQELSAGHLLSCPDWGGSSPRDPDPGDAPRRSVYVQIIRNRMDPFLAAFDAPVPASSVGRRDVTNVPGQSLTLLNSSFVRDLARKWGKRVGLQEGNDEDNITFTGLASFVIFSEWSKMLP